MITSECTTAEQKASGIDNFCQDESSGDRDLSMRQPTCSSLDHQSSTTMQEAKSPTALWNSIEDTKQASWYGPSVSYWDRQDASYDGVLGGYGHVSNADITESERFLKKALGKQLQEGARKTRRLTAVDCGAGIGRVTEQLLVRYFDQIDLVEPSRHLLAEADKRLRNTSSEHPAAQKLDKSLCMGLQDFDPEQKRYDAIWIQWALLYLTDGDATAFLRRCSTGIKDDGVIFVKENICSNTQNFVLDEEDKSLTRSSLFMQRLFDDAGMQLLYSAQQKNFPKELFKVQMYALRPKSKT